MTTPRPRSLRQALRHERARRRYWLRQAVRYAAWGLRLREELAAATGRRAPWPR